LWNAWTAAPPAGGDSLTGGPVDGHALSAYAGVYRLNRYSRATIARLGVLTGDVPEVRVAVAGHQLTLDGVPLILVDARHARRQSDGRLIAFRLAGDGAASHLFYETDPYDAFERVPWWDHVPVQLGLLLFLLLTTAVALVRDVHHVRRGAGAVTLVFTVVDALTLAAVALLAVVLITTDPWSFQYGIPLHVDVARALPWLPLVAAGSLLCIKPAIPLRASVIRLILQVSLLGWFAHWHLLFGT
jgi:hypothetical protein